MTEGKSGYREKVEHSEQSSLAQTVEDVLLYAVIYRIWIRKEDSGLCRWINDGLI